MNQSQFDHFIAAQQPVYDRGLEELSLGQKETHWMWFIFPQVAGLGRCDMAQRFALRSLDEARRYAAHPTLGNRLRQCTQLVVNTNNRSPHAIFGSPDDLKFHSSMTLFALVVRDEPLFAAALAKYFERRPDVTTLKLLRGVACGAATARW